MDGAAFPPETTFRTQIVNASGEYLGTATFSSYLESGEVSPVEDLAAALRDVYRQHGMDLQQFSAAVPAELDWPQEANG